MLSTQVMCLDTMQLFTLKHPTMEGYLSKLSERDLAYFVSCKIRVSVYLSVVKYSFLCIKNYFAHVICAQKYQYTYFYGCICIVILSF